MVLTVINHLVSDPFVRELIDPLPDLRAYIADKVFHAVALRQMFAYGNVLYQNFPDPTRGVEVPTTMPPPEQD